MLKAVLEVLGPGFRSFELAALVVAFPLAAAIKAWLAESRWVSSTGTLGMAVVLAVVLLAMSAWVHRFLSVRMARSTFLDVARPGPVGRAGWRKGDPPLPSEPGGDRGTVVLGSRPPEASARPAEERRSELVLDDLRSRMDEVSYTPGSPNILSMTKYLHDDGSQGAASPRAADLARDEAGVSVSRDGSGDRTVLRIEGVLDAVTVSRVRPIIGALVAERHRAITVDLSSLRLIDSAGVGVIVSLYKRCKAFGGTVQVTGLKDQPLAIFRMLRLDRIFIVP